MENTQNIVENWRKNVENRKDLTFLRFSMYYLSIFLYFLVGAHILGNEEWRMKSEEWELRSSFFFSEKWRVKNRADAIGELKPKNVIRILHSSFFI